MATLLVNMRDFGCPFYNTVIITSGETCGVTELRWTSRQKWSSTRGIIRGPREHVC